MMPLPKELFDASVALEGNEWNIQALSALESCKGILLFADDRQRPIQLLQSANLRRTAQARLLRDDTPSLARKADLSVLTRYIFASCRHNDFSNWLEYLKIARAFSGQPFLEDVRLPTVFFAAIDLNAPLPYFYVSSNSAISENRQAWGLFASRKAALDFCQTLNTVFTLCRNPSLLQTGNEPSCPYLQMQQCPGPCLDQITRSEYMQWVRQALEAADGGLSNPITKFESEMHQAAADKRFELAQTYKQRIERLKHLKDSTGQWTQNLIRFCILHVDRGPKMAQTNQKRKQQQFIAWKITRNLIREIGRFTLNLPDDWTADFTNQWPNPSRGEIQLNPSEHFGLLSLLLFRSRPQGLWLDASQTAPDAASVMQSAASL